MANKTWNNAGAGNASTGTWSPVGAPVAGDNIIFDATSVQNCTWDIAATFGTFTIAATYSGTITQGAVDFGYSDFSMAGGGWKGAYTRWQSCSGNFTQTAGVIDSDTTWIKLIGVGKTVRTVSSVTAAGQNWWFTGSYTINTCFAFRGTLTIDGSLTTSVAIYTHWNAIALVGGSGTLYCSGAAEIAFAVYNADKHVSFPTISGLLKITFGADWSITGPRSYILDKDLSAGIILVTDSGNHNFVTLNVNGKSLSATSITASTRGIISSSVAGAKIDAGTGGITASANGTITATNISEIKSQGNIDVSAGTWTPGTGPVIIHGTVTPKTVKTGAGQTFYDLICERPIKLLSNISVTHIFAHTDPVDLNSYAVTMTDPYLEYTCLRVPFVRQFSKKQIGGMAANALLEDIEKVI